MKIRKLLTLFACSLLLSSGLVIAEEHEGVDGDDGEPEKTLADMVMELLPPTADNPGAITNDLALPDVVALDSPARDKAGMINGLSTAKDARDRGAEFGQEMAENAAANRENFSRGNRPDHAGPPETPPTPETPGRP